MWQQTKNSFRETFSGKSKHGNCGNHGNHGNGQINIQSQQYASTQEQKKKIVFQRVFQGQVIDIYSSVLNLIKISSQFDECMANMATDMVITSMNGFAKTCCELQQERDYDTLDLGKKTVFDKWEHLQLKDAQTYEKSLKYRDFMITALNSKILISYNVERVLSQKDAQIQNECINNDELVLSAYSEMIGNHNKFNRKVDSYNNDTFNKQLKLQNEKALNEYRKSNKYQMQNKMYSNVETPDINAMYLTNSGRNSQFKMDETAQAQQDQIDAEINGYDCDDQKESKYWVNGIIGANKHNPLQALGISISKSVPVQVEIDTNTNAKTVHKYRCKLPNPWCNRYIFVNPNEHKMLINRDNAKTGTIVQNILKHEKKWNMSLGYPYVNGEDQDMINEVTGGMNDINGEDQNINMTDESDEAQRAFVIINGCKINGLPKKLSKQERFPCVVLEQCNNNRYYVVQLAKPYDDRTLKISAKRIAFISSDPNAMEMD